MTNRDKAQRIATILGGKFIPSFAWGDNIELGIGNLFLRYTGHSKKGQWYISASVPRSNEVYIAQTDRPTLSIYVSESKDAETIARDIQRRLLPQLAAFSARVSERLAESDAYNSKVKSNLELACSLIDAEAESTESARFHTDTFYGSIQAGADTVKLEIRSLPLDAMKAVLETLARFKQ